MLNLITWRAQGKSLRAIVLALSVSVGIFYLERAGSRRRHRQKGRKNSRQLVCRTQQRGRVDRPERDQYHQDGETY